MSLVGAGRGCVWPASAGREGSSFVLKSPLHPSSRICATARLPPHTHTHAGYYHDGAFGIRIENIVLVQPAATPHAYGGPYYGFEHVTLVPIQTKLVRPDLLTGEEREWLNAYHRECWTKVSPLLERGSLALRWLERETRAI